MKEDLTLTAKNLTLLADYVEAHVPAENIYMSYFRSDLNDEGVLGAVSWRDEYNCGTAGCMLGWAPRVPTLEPIESDFKGFLGYAYEILQFVKYGARVFPALYSDGDYTENWKAIFDCDLPDDKPALIAGVRAMAAKLRGEVK